jgi:phytoene synthase
VAATVGVMMTVLMGRREPGVLARACDLGVAMQLTNICRDVGEDARNGRVYLPPTWLARPASTSRRSCAAPSFSAPSGAVIERTPEGGRPALSAPAAGVAMLPRDCRMAIRAARLLYANIGTRGATRGAGDSVSLGRWCPGAQARAAARGPSGRASRPIASRREGDAPALRRGAASVDDAVQGVDAG